MASCSDPLPKPRPAVLRRLWERMAALYHHRWTSALGDMPQGDDGSLTVAGDTWARGLAGITPEQVGQGVDACLTRSDAWPPTLPEFRALCLQVPSFDETRLHVTTSRVTDAPFYRLVWQLLDTHRFRTSPAQDSDRVLRAAYEAARDHVMRLRPMPDGSAGLLAPPPVKLREFDFVPPPEVLPADAKIQQLREQLAEAPAAEHTPAEEPDA